MSGGMARQALGDLRTLFRLGVAADLSDGQLLNRFVERREGAEDAFAMLVRRHGPMVFGVCRRILGSAHEAEDAFQATFLVLARKASTIARRGTLANWLYGVALRTAKDSRSRARRRRAWEQRACELRVVAAAGDDPVQELRLILDEELARLPARFRTPVLLCELELLSRQEAALRLGIPEGTLSSRLARAKALLRERLTRRGVGLPAALLSGYLAREAQAAPVPVVLVESTIRAAALIAAGCSATELVTASVQSLMGEVLNAMLFAKLKGLAFTLVAAGAVVTGAMVLAQDYGTQKQDHRAGSAVPALPAPADPVVGILPRDEFTKTAVPPPHARRPEPDRLSSLEQKLDRILEALGSSRAPAAYVDPLPSAAQPAVAPAAAGAQPGQPTRLDPFLAGTPAPALAPERADRLTALERRMAELDRRLAALERHVYEGIGASPSTNIRNRPAERNTETTPAK